MKHSICTINRAYTEAALSDRQSIRGMGGATVSLSCRYLGGLKKLSMLKYKIISRYNVHLLSTHFLSPISSLKISPLSKEVVTYITMPSYYDFNAAAILKANEEEPRSQPWKAHMNTGVAPSAEEWITVEVRNNAMTNAYPMDARTNAYPMGDIDARTNAYPMGDIDARTNAYPMGDIDARTNAYPMGDIDARTNAYPI